MATISVIDKAPILDQDGTQLTTASATVFSSDQNVVGIQFADGPVFAVGNGAGSATITAHRLADGAVSTLEVEVTNAAPFAISLGAVVPK